MRSLSFLTDNGVLPKPAEPERAQRELDIWRHEAHTRSGDDPELAEFMADLVAQDEGQEFLRAIFGNSPFLSLGLRHDPAILHQVTQHGFDRTFEDMLTALADRQLWRHGRADVMSGLRLAKRGVALTIAMADIAGAWPLEKVCRSLSQFAEMSISIALNYLLFQAHKSEQLLLADPENPEFSSGVVVLGMGKLGARELNYSSDIDLLVLFDGEKVNHRSSDGPQQGLHRMVREMVSLLGERSADGYVFRTDMRLRPDPGATPLAVSTAAAEQYYESLGQNWERAAMIKARAVAGDLEVGAQFLSRLVPFVWRKYLDFAAIEDIHSIKRQINAHKGHHEIAVAGHDIKVGRGGIREIEFYAQTQQLIWGGKEPGLRLGATCEALHALAEAGHADPVAVDDLVTAYAYLRRLEHRLQMVADEQTHLLPAEAEGLAAIACFMGYGTTDELARDVKFHLSRVESHYAALFEDSPELGGSGGNLVFTGTEDDPDTLQTLSELGFSDGKAISATVRGWHHGRVRAMRSPRARQLLTELMPRLLGAFAATAHPDNALMRFQEFLNHLPAGVQLFSLFQSNTDLLDLVAEIMGTAPRLAEHLARTPTLLDHVLSIDFLEPLGHADSLGTDLDDNLVGVRDLEDLLDRVRRWTHDREFQLGIHLLRGLVSATDAARGLSDLTDAVLRRLLPRVADEFAQQHGELDGGAAAVLALGKYGARELNFGSDLDIVFVYDHAADTTASDGARPLPASLYFSRINQRFVSALTTMTNAGRLFEIDMRLRPSGSAGPLASELGGYLRYQAEEAWLWEHMALTKLRMVCGPSDLAAAVMTGVRDVLCRSRDPGEVAHTVVDMRGRIEREHTPLDRFDVKYAAGGLIDLEFVAQTLQLVHAAEQPGILASSSTVVFGAMADYGLMSRTEADELIAASRLMQDVQGVVRLAMAQRTREADLPGPLCELLVRISGTADFAALQDRLDTAQAQVRKAFARHVAAHDNHATTET